MAHVIWHAPWCASVCPPHKRISNKQRCEYGVDRMRIGMMVKREQNGNGDPIYKVFGLPVGSYFAPIAGTALLGICVWLIQLNGTATYNTRVISKLEAEQEQRTAYIGRILVMDAELKRVASVQESVIAGNIVSIASLRNRLDQMEAMFAEQKTSCERVWQRVDDLRRDVDRIIIKLNPSDSILRK